MGKGVGSRNLKKKGWEVSCIGGRKRQCRKLDPKNILYKTFHSILQLKNAERQETIRNEWELELGSGNFGPPVSAWPPHLSNLPDLQD